MIMYYLVGAVTGGLVGYFVLYRLIGCSTGACPITANPYISTLYGIILGVLLVTGIASPKNPAASKDATLSSETAYKKITAEDAKARIDSENEVIILDVRTEEEYKAVHIPNEPLGLRTVALCERFMHSKAVCRIEHTFWHRLFPPVFVCLDGKRTADRKHILGDWWWTMRVFTCKRSEPRRGLFDSGLKCFYMADIERAHRSSERALR